MDTPDKAFEIATDQPKPARKRSPAKNLSPSVETRAAPAPTAAQIKESKRRHLAFQDAVHNRALQRKRQEELAKRVSATASRDDCKFDSYGEFNRYLQPQADRNRQMQRIVARYSKITFVDGPTCKLWGPFIPSGVRFRPQRPGRGTPAVTR